MARWSSECRLWTVAFVALLCLGCDAHAFALCESCPELFPSTAAPEQAAPPRQLAQSIRPHDHSVSRRRHQRRDDPRAPSLARRTPLTAFAAVTLERGGAGASVSAAVADSAPVAPDAAMPATPAFRIDELFNIMAAGPSDPPERVAALRASMLSQLRVRQTSPGPDDRTGYLVPTLIAFGGGLLLISAVFVSARRHAFAPPRTLGWQGDRSMLPSDRARRRRNHDISLEGRTRRLAEASVTRASLREPQPKKALAK
jgi:hypothetical protein